MRGGGWGEFPPVFDELRRAKKARGAGPEKSGEDHSRQCHFPYHLQIAHPEGVRVTVVAESSGREASCPEHHSDFGPGVRVEALHQALRKIVAVDPRYARLMRVAGMEDLI